MFILKPVQRTTISTGNYMFLFGQGPAGYASGMPGPVSRYNGTTVSSEGSLSTAVYSMAGTNLSDTAFIFGGAGTTGFDAHGTTYVQRFKNSVGSLDSATLPSRSHGGCAEVLSSIAYHLSAGSALSSTDSIESYDGSSLITTGVRFNQNPRCKSAVLGSKIYVFGGYVYDKTTTLYGDSNRIDSFDGSVTAASGQTLANAIGTTAVGLLSTNAFIFGGSSGVTNYNTIQRYDGTTRSTDSATMSVSGSLETAAAISGNCYIFAGSGPVYKYNGTTFSTDTVSSSVVYLALYMASQSVGSLT